MLLSGCPSCMVYGVAGLFEKLLWYIMVKPIKPLSYCAFALLPKRRIYPDLPLTRMQSSSRITILGLLKRFSTHKYYKANEKLPMQ